MTVETDARTWKGVGRIAAGALAEIAHALHRIADRIGNAAAVTVERLRPRRGCLEGAQQTLEAVQATLANADSLEAARASLVPQVDERLELLDLALRQFDAALAGEEPPSA